MVKYLKLLRRKETVFRRLTGVKKKTFRALLRIINRYFSENRKLGGPKYNLKYGDMLLLMLTYYREYTTYLSISQQFDISETTAFRNVRLIEEILINSETLKLPSREDIRSISLDEVVLIDATEIAIERPKKKQKDWYSGKKKKHTAKFQICVQKTSGKVLETAFAKGAVHDFKVLKDSKTNLNKEQKLGVDLGYQGILEFFPNASIPVKKSKKIPLTKEQKESNREFSRVRIKVENVIACLKKFNILSSKYRNRRKRIGLRFNLVCSIYNFELRK